MYWDKKQEGGGEEKAGGLFYMIKGKSQALL